MMNYINKSNRPKNLPSIDITVSADDRRTASFEFKMNANNTVDVHLSISDSYISNWSRTVLKMTLENDQVIPFITDMKRFYNDFQDGLNKLGSIVDSYSVIQANEKICIGNGGCLRLESKYAELDHSSWAGGVHVYTAHLCADESYGLMTNVLRESDEYLNVYALFLGTTKHEGYSYLKCFLHQVIDSMRRDLTPLFDLCKSIVEQMEFFLGSVDNESMKQ